MIEDMADALVEEKSPRSIWEKLINYLKNPLISLILSVVVSVTLYYFIERKDIEPRYSTSSTEVIAEHTLEEQELQLFWQGKEIRDLSYVKVAIWNAGEQYLGQEHVMESDPIRIIIPPGVKVLYADFIEKSRPTLDFSIIYYPTEDDVKEIRLQILNGDALEKNDGGILKILFTGVAESEFSVKGRIKSTQGFVKTLWWFSPQDRFIFSTMAFGFIILTWWIFITIVYKLKRIKSLPNLTVPLRISYWIRLLFLLVLEILFIYMVIYSVPTTFLSYSIPSWLSP